VTVPHVEPAIDALRDPKELVTVKVIERRSPILYALRPLRSEEEAVEHQLRL
jgi:hypothetical protein